MFGCRGVRIATQPRHGHAGRGAQRGDKGQEQTAAHRGHAQLGVRGSKHGVDGTEPLVQRLSLYGRPVLPVKYGLPVSFTFHHITLRVSDLRRARTFTRVSSA